MNKECHTLAADPTSASYIGMSFLLTMIKQAVRSEERRVGKECLE